MHRTAAFLLLALATSRAPALANPPYHFPEERDTWRDRDRYDREYDRDRYDGWQRRSDYADRWLSLSAYANARDASTYIRLPRTMRMSRVKVEGSHGAPVVTVVEVFYKRHVQRARVDRRLLRGEVIEVPVDQRREVQAIVVHTDPRSRGGYSVSGGVD
jgi:hypothetical protein